MFFSRTFPVDVPLFLESWFVVSLEHFPGDIVCKNLQNEGRLKTPFPFK